MEKNRVNNGFTYLGEKKSEETSSTVHYFRHEKSGADLIWFENDDDNKTFGIGFKTPPEDSTGVAHIVEHCVLSGSRKFKTREPFMELAKSSMATFLNAMTYDDMTLYPISSMNDKDFRNLMDVYLDAVLYPAIYDNKKIFMQEGWHYELNNEKDPIIHKGVVYNEMKGAYSSPLTQIYYAMASRMHPDSTYSNESGGYPYAIPDLTYENFLEFHRKNYHPSNSLIVLYGRMDIEDTLKFIDSEYLNAFERLNDTTEIRFSESRPQKEVLEVPYHSEATDTREKNSYLSYTVNLGTSLNPEDAIVNSLLSDVIIESQSAPVKLALLKSGIAEDVFGSFTSQDYYQDISIIAKNADAGKMEEFTEIIEGTLRKMVDEGIDKDLLKGAMNKYEINRREGQGTVKGVIFFINAVRAWLYGKDPISNLTYNETFRKLREEMDNGFFENYIKERILNSDHKLRIIHTPDPEFFSKEDEKERKRLDEYKKSLSKEEIASLIKENEELTLFQSKDDSKEDKNTIPRLSREDLPTSITDIPERTEKSGDVTYLIHEMPTSSMSYINVLFDIAHLTAEELPYVSYLTEMLSMMDTDNYSYTELNNVITIDTSGISVNTRVKENLKKPGEYSIRLDISSSAIGERWRRIFELMEEIVLRTKIDDKARIREILNMVKTNMESYFDGAGNVVAMNRSSSFFNRASWIEENLSGVTFFDDLMDLLSNYDERIDGFISQLQKVYDKAFRRGNMLIAITSEDKTMKEIVEEGRRFSEKISDEKITPVEISFKEDRKQEGISTAANVQYVSKSADIRRLGYDFRGDMVVLTTVLSRDYLHNAIRARGGAYGAGIRITQSGVLSTYSYRDPNLRNTVDVYDRMPEFVENLSYDDDDIKNFIVGSMTSFVQPVVPSIVNGIMINRYLSSMNKETIEKTMKEATEATRDSLRGYAGMLKDAMAENYMVTLGNKAQVEKEKDLFSEIRPLKK